MRSGVPEESRGCRLALNAAMDRLMDTVWIVSVSWAEPRLLLSSAPLGPSFSKPWWVSGHHGAVAGELKKSL